MRAGGTGNADQGDALIAVTGTGNYTLNTTGNFNMEGTGNTTWAFNVVQVNGAGNLLATIGGNATFSGGSANASGTKKGARHLLTCSEQEPLL